MLGNPMPLDTALTICFPHGGVQKSTMLKAIRQGKLNCSRLGRVYLVTAMFCRVAPLATLGAM